MGRFGTEDEVDEQEGGAADDGAVGEVEVWPHVVADVEVQEVGDAAKENSVVEIADGSAENEGKSQASGREFFGGLPEQIADDDHGNGREADEHGDTHLGRPVGEEAEGGSGVFYVSDGKEVRDDLHVSEIQFDVAGYEKLSEAVAENHDRRHG